MCVSQTAVHDSVFIQAAVNISLRGERGCMVVYTLTSTIVFNGLCKIQVVNFKIEGLNLSANREGILVLLKVQ